MFTHQFSRQLKIVNMEHEEKGKHASFRTFSKFPRKTPRIFTMFEIIFSRT